ncbi:MAG TPA: HAMP domain-containing sensor histidine kinase [Geobacteraceae bacterium]|nr:HAMP domain-containing sensor histidine kinase [Geobacteraceae bacterium]
MRFIKRLFHPLIALIGIQVVWLLAVFLWIYWFVGRHKEIRKLAEIYRLELVERGLDWLVLVEGIILLVLVLAGVYVIFVYWKRQSDLVIQQKNIMAQVTHELKSPLASIQLHLETIKLRNLPREKVERFLDTMLADTDRLNNLISNLLMAAKLEHRGRTPVYPVIDFSDFVVKFMEHKRAKLPEGGTLSLDVENGIRAHINVEEMETILRNLFENAVLYSNASPEISVSLSKKGSNTLLTFRDNGRGIESKDLKKVFRMFYRVRTPGENIRGTGLGLHIVKSLIKDHGGQIRVTSEGLGKGCAFHITLPLASD